MAKKKVKEERITTIYTYSYLAEVWGEWYASDELTGGTIKVVLTPEMREQASNCLHTYLLQQAISKIEQRLARKKQELGTLYNLTLLSTQLKREVQEVL